MFHLVVASEYQAALCCSRPLSLILSCSAYLPRVHTHRAGSVMSLHLSQCGRPCCCPTHPSTQTPVYFLTHVSSTCTYEAACMGGVVKLWDPGSGGNDRFRGCCGRRVDRGWPMEDMCDMKDPVVAWSDDILCLMSRVNTAHVRVSCPPQRAVNLPPITNTGSII